MARRDDAPRDLLFGLLALQNGLIDQVQLVAAFQAWTRDKARALADYLVARGDLDADDRSAVEALVSRHLKKHAGDAERSLAALRTGPWTRHGLRSIDDPDLAASLAVLAPGGDNRAQEHASVLTAAHSRVTLAEDDDDGPTLAPAGDLPLNGGETRYQFLGEIARGGMGAVLKARDPGLGRDLAVKVLLDRHREQPDLVRRFVEEAQICGQLQHPGVVPVYELGTLADRRPYLHHEAGQGPDPRGAAGGAQRPAARPASVPGDLRGRSARRWPMRTPGA